MLENKTEWAKLDQTRQREELKELVNSSLWQEFKTRVNEKVADWNQILDGLVPSDLKTIFVREQGFGEKRGISWFCDQVESELRELNTKLNENKNEQRRNTDSDSTV